MKRHRTALAALGLALMVAICSGPIVRVIDNFSQLSGPEAAQAGGALIVASANADASIRRKADYLCDGTADQVQIQAAIDACAAGKAHEVYLAAPLNVVDPFVLSAPIVLKSGVTLRGSRPAITMTGANPDMGWSYAGGAILTGPGLTLITADTPGDTPIQGCCIRDLVFDTCDRAIDIGSQNSYGIAFSRFEDLWISEVTTCGIRLRNFQHVRMDHVNMYNVAKGLHLVSDNTSGARYPGNSVISDVYVFTKQSGVFRDGVIHVEGSGSWQVCFVTFIRPQVNVYDDAGGRGLKLYKTWGCEFYGVDMEGWAGFTPIHCEGSYLAHFAIAHAGRVGTTAPEPCHFASNAYGISIDCADTRARFEFDQASADVTHLKGIIASFATGSKTPHGVYKVGDGPTAVRGTFLPAAVADYTDGGNIYLPVRRYLIAGNDWWSFLADSTDPTRGFRVQFRLYGSVHVLSGIYEGRLRPAWYAPFTPGSTGGGIVTMNDGGNQMYRYSTGKWCQWTVPAAGVGCNKLVVNYWQQTTGGQASVTVNGQAVGAVDCVGANEHNHTVEITLSSALVLNDLVRITGTTAEEARIYAFWVYSTTSNWSAVHHRILTDETVLVPQGSAIEAAMSLGPTGQSAKWFMGTHQGGSNGSQVDVVETVVWPSGWSAVGGYGISSSGAAVITRTSTLRYDATPTDIATAEEQYLFSGVGLSYWGRVVTTASIDSPVRYPGMLPVSRDATLVFSDAGVAVDPTGDESEVNYFCPVSRMWGAVVGDVAICESLAGCSEAQQRGSLEPRTDLVKTYFHLRTLTAAPIGTTWEWSLALWGVRAAAVGR